MKSDFATKWFNELQVLEDKCDLPFPKRIKSHKTYVAMQQGSVVSPKDVTEIISTCKGHYRLCKRAYVMLPVFLCRLSFSLCLLTAPIWLCYLIKGGHFPTTLGEWFCWVAFGSFHPFPIMMAFACSISFGIHGSFLRESKSDPFAKVMISLLRVAYYALGNVVACGILFYVVMFLFVYLAG